MCLRARCTVTLTEEKVKQYALLSGDQNPIHLDPEIAQEYEFERPIAHGMLVMGIGAKLLASAYDEGVHVSEYEMKFLKPIFVNDCIEMIVTQNDDSKRIAIEGYVSEEKVLKGKVRLR